MEKSPIGQGNRAPKYTRREFLAASIRFARRFGERALAAVGITVAAISLAGCAPSEFGEGPYPSQSTGTEGGAPIPPPTDPNSLPPPVEVVNEGQQAPEPIPAPEPPPFDQLSSAELMELEMVKVTASASDDSTFITPSGQIRTADELDQEIQKREQNSDPDLNTIYEKTKQWYDFTGFSEDGMDDMTCKEVWDALWYAAARNMGTKHGVIEINEINGDSSHEVVAVKRVGADGTRRMRFLKRGDAVNFLNDNCKDQYTVSYGLDGVTITPGVNPGLLSQIQGMSEEDKKKLIAVGAVVIFAIIALTMPGTIPVIVGAAALAENDETKEIA